MGATTINDVVIQHAEEAAFLWTLRDSAVSAPHFRLRDLSNLDDRVDAHVDGLRVSGDAGWAFAKEQLSSQESGEVFAAAVLAFESSDPKPIATVLDLAASDSRLDRPVLSALGWMSPDAAKPALESLISSGRPELRRLGLAGYAVHRIDPGRALWEASSDDDPAIRGQALKLAGELGRTDLSHLVARAISTPADDRCRFYASWSAALLGVRDNDVMDTLRSIAASDTQYAAAALHTSVRCLRSNDATNWISTMLRDPKHAKLSLTAAGALGDPALVPQLIECMQVEQLSRAAGEAFSMITGADLVDLGLEGSQPEDFEPRPNDNPADPNVAMDEDENLPWPGADLISDWWEAHYPEFQPGIRYLLGKPISMEWMQRVLRIGRQRQRAAAALELAIMQPGTLLFEVRAPGFRQQEMLGLSPRR